MRCDPIEVTYRVQSSVWVPVSILLLVLASSCQAWTNQQILRRVNELIELQGKQITTDIVLPVPSPSKD